MQKWPSLRHGTTLLSAAPLYCFPFARSLIVLPSNLQVHDGMDTLGGREAAAILTALAWQRYRPHDAWLLRLTAALQPQLPLVSGRSLAMLLHSCARLGFRPPGAWMQAFSAAALGQAGQLSALDAASVLWAFAVLEFELPGPGLEAALVLALPAAAAGSSLRDGSRAQAAWALTTLFPGEPKLPAVTAALDVLRCAAGGLPSVSGEVEDAAGTTVTSVEAKGDAVAYPLSGSEEAASSLFRDLTRSLLMLSAGGGAGAMGRQRY
jgi:hypothetical protein